MKMRQLAFAVAMICGAAMVTGDAFAIDIPVNNALFDSPTLPATSAPTDGRGSWGLAAWSGGDVGTYSPAPPFPSQDGNNVGFLSVSGTQAGGAAFFQDVTRIQEGTYSVTVDVAREPGAEPTTVPFKINFEAVDFGPFAFLGTNDFLVGSFNSTDLTSATATVTIPNGSANIGQYLRPVLLVEGQDAGSVPANSRATYNLDNVRMDYTPPAGTPEPVVVGQHLFDPLAWQRPASLGNSAGEYKPLAPALPNQVGDQLGFIALRNSGGGFGALFQDVTTIAEGTYTWTIGVAYDSGSEPTSTPFKLNFEAVGGGTSLLSENIFPVGSANSTSFTDVSVSLTIPAGSADIGRDLRLVMVADGQEAGATYLFDNVRLDFAPVPEPTSAVLSIIAFGAVGYGRSRRFTLQC
ncbi:PEP-CTERM sorting domain-containing protein [Bythopirellula goksoeyrii]|uniref:Ice-binding protein C-terminal domain-containing protein n=1 Tax=Bythopirellula goksoeyrii TaxID=1400387 RepID=A0A5B9QI72_9BACT|nr:PEP-CTERM sorting domain-containing protein [Bythopirellula goksoeyrii]QEG33921.1 hypothetical protein Pr1d_11920 [Bythopirellula goksoeyrii]